jgi:hypothetical protein
MSEYQYYEFQAIDRPLSEKQMDQLRRYSTRARITTTSFVNEYQWGNFRGDADRWMERYFDAFLYTANWGTRILKLRLPSKVLSLSEVRPYCAGQGLAARQKSGSTILTFSSDDEGGDDGVDADGMLAALVPVRADLARGDGRALYLGWVAAAQVGECPDDDQEPPVPPGLGQLTASLRALAEFLRIDEQLLLAAAQVSAPLRTERLNRDRFTAWVTTLSTAEKDKVLVRLLSEDAASVRLDLLHRFRRDQAPSSPRGREERRRTFSEIRKTAEELEGVATQERRRPHQGRRRARGHSG